MSRLASRVSICKGKEVYMKQKRNPNVDHYLDGWRDRYVVKQHGSVGRCWALYSSRWHSVRPMKRISPYFEYRSDVEEWIRDKWKSHMDNKLERMLLR